MSNHKTPRVHLDQGGRARCGNPGASLTGPEEEVTCARCIAIMNGTYGVGHHQTDSPHGSAARYRWHLRHQGKPVRCESCLQAERRRNQDRRDDLRRAA